MITRNFVVETEPPVEPVTLAELYSWLRLDPEGSTATHPHDDMLTILLKAARKTVEAITKRKLVQQTIDMVLSSFPNTYDVFRRGADSYDRERFSDRPRGIELLYPPLIEVISVSYYDENNDIQVWPSTKWFVSEKTLPPVLNCTDGQVWPMTFGRPDAVQIRYVVGYPPDGSPGDGPDLAANVPEGIKQAIMIEVQLGYDQLSVEQRNALVSLRNNLLSSYKVYTE